jgi:hypothetical protein
MIDAFIESDRCNIETKLPDYELLIETGKLEEADARGVLPVLIDDVKGSSQGLVIGVFASLARFFDRKAPRTDWTAVEADMYQATHDLVLGFPLEECQRKEFEQCFVRSANKYWPLKSNIENLGHKPECSFDIHSFTSPVSHRIEIHLSFRLKVELTYNALRVTTFNLIEVEGVLSFDFPLVAEVDTGTSFSTIPTMGSWLTSSIFGSSNRLTSASASSEEPILDNLRRPASIYWSGSAGGHDESWKEWYAKSLSDCLAKSGR